MPPWLVSILRDKLHDQVTRYLEQGATLLCGGTLPEHPGALYPATLLGDVKLDMVAFNEELFGPVGALIKAKDEAEAIQLAKQSSFGLGSAIFTKDLAKRA